MIPPDQSSGSGAYAASLSWWWRLEDSSGGELSLPEYADERFASQADAESWVGEIWSDLADAGVDQVTLFEADRQVYGPMSLHA